MSWCGAYERAAAAISGPAADKELGVVSAFRWGLSCGAASCMNKSNSVFDLADAQWIFDRIDVVDGLL
jgi:fructose-1-phosphate kinase PfkB-like protein